MIRFKLLCTHGHEFEGWFRNAEAFDVQQQTRQISCPDCGDDEVRKALMAPAVATGRREPSGDVIPDRVQAVLQRLRREVEAQCDDVGEGFAEAALNRQQMAEDGKTLPSRGIYGTMTPEDRIRLDDEGVEYAAVPWVERADG